MMAPRSLIVFLLFLLAFVASFNCCAGDVSKSHLLDGARAAFASCDGLHGVHVIRDGGVVCIRGKIDPGMFVSLLRKRHDIRRNPYVVISGMGGYGDSSIYMVRMLDAYDPVPVVGDMCASACAQFLFLMGRHRVLLHCADLVIHGGPPTMDEALSWNNDDELTQRIVANIFQVKKFYRKRGISMDMLVKPPLDVQKRLNSGEVVFWPWSIRQLRHFGVKGIVSRNDPDDVVPDDYKDACLGR